MPTRKKEVTASVRSWQLYLGWNLNTLPKQIGVMRQDKLALTEKDCRSGLMG